MIDLITERETHTRQINPFPRRPDATGEMPRIIAMPIGMAQLERLSAGETLILPDGPRQMPARPSVPTVYGPQPTEPPPLPPQPSGPVIPPRPDGYRPTHRKPAPLWTYVTAGVGLVLASFAAGWVSCWSVAL